MTAQTNRPGPPVISPSAPAVPASSSLRTSAPADTIRVTPALERRGRAWLLWSFLLCPCHLPLTLAALTAVLAGTSLGVTLRDHVWVAGAIVTAAWVAGTGYGLRLIRRAEKENGACPARATPGA